MNCDVDEATEGLENELCLKQETHYERPARHGPNGLNGKQLRVTKDGRVIRQTTPGDSFVKYDDSSTVTPLVARPANTGGNSKLFVEIN